MCQQHNVEEWRSNAPLHSEIGYQSLNVPAIWQIFTMTSTALFITWMETNSYVSMEVHATGEDVGTRQSTETQLCTISTATDRLTFGVTPLSCIAFRTMSITYILGSIFSFIL